MNVEERAIKAYHKFNDLAPTLSGFAEALAGKEMIVKAGKGVHTEGKVITIRPPLALADDHTHDRKLCDKRDENYAMMCPACAARDEMMGYLFHELGHIVFDSFKRSMMGSVYGRLEDFVSQWPSAEGKLIANINSMPHDKKDSPLYASKYLNKFMPGLLNALEDVRVDTRMIEARPGIENMHRAMFVNLAVFGYEDTGKKFIDLDLNIQIGLAMIARAKGYGYDETFNPYVIQTLDDPKIKTLLNSVQAARNVESVFAITFKIMVECQRFGFFVYDDRHTYYKEEERDETDDSGQPEGAGDASDSTSPDGNGEEGDAEGGEGKESDSAGAGDSQVPGESDDEASLLPEADSGADEERQDRVGDSGLADDRADRPEESSEENPDESGDVDQPGAGEDVSVQGEACGDSDSDSPGEQPSMDDEPSGAEGDRDAESDSMGRDGNDEAGGEGGLAEPDSDPEASSMGTEGGEESDGGDSSDSSGAGAGLGDGESPAGTPASGSSAGADGSLDDSPTGDLFDGGEGEATNVERPDAAEFGRDEKGAAERMGIITGHTRDDEIDMTPLEEEVMDRVVGSLENFDAVSRAISSVKILDVSHFGRRVKESVARPTSESILGPAVLHMRRVFKDNALADKDRNRRSGRVSSRVLGRRAWGDDDRLFTKKRKPGKRDYAVLIGIDASGSTNAGPDGGYSRGMKTIELELLAARAQAELCHRMGIKFAIYAHSGNHDQLLIVPIKDFHEPWNTKTQQKLAQVSPFAANLDGHTIEYYRKQLEKVKATDKILMYYSDGAMPAENYREELTILQREIRTFKSKGMTLMAVGARTSDPKKHGLDTVRIDGIKDIVKVVQHLGKRIEEMRPVA